MSYLQRGIKICIAWHDPAGDGHIVVTALGMMKRMTRFVFLLLLFVLPGLSAPACSAQAPNLDNEYTSLAAGAEVFIRIFKEEDELELWLKAPEGDTFELAETFPICAWSGSLGPKLREGDGQSPEGFYRVRLGSLNPNSAYHLSFNLGFPNAYDRAHGRTGSYLMVHGACVSIGCYAMTDGRIERIYGAVETALKGGQDAVEVHIFPFRMTDEALAEHGGSEWIDFWRNLKQGHDYFETRRQVPRIAVDQKRYTFE